MATAGSLPVSQPPFGPKGGSIRRRGPRQKSPPRLHPLYLRLDWTDNDPWHDSATAAAARTRGEPRILKPGQQYGVEARILGYKSGDAASDALYPESDLQLTLIHVTTCPSAKGTVEIEPQEGPHIALEHASGFRHKFTLTVANDCCRQEGTLVLYCSEVSSGGNLSLNEKIRVEGSFESEIDSRANLALDRSVARDVVIVFATQPKKNKLEVVGWHGYERRYPSKPRKPMQRPNTELAALLEKWGASKEMLTHDDFHGLTLNVIDEVSYFSRYRAGDLFGWLWPLLQRPSPPSIIIVDHTPFEVPWEMIQLDFDKPLGALASVARWPLVKAHPARAKAYSAIALPCSAEEPASYALTLQIEQQASFGKVIAFRDGNLLESGYPIPNMLLTQRCKDIPALLERLRQPLDGVCLVYLHCHGDYDKDDTTKSTLANRWAINFAAIPPQQGALPLFFVNACHSARLGGKDGASPGLAEILLGGVASGYIGTLGRVEEGLAAKVATTLLDRAIDAPHGLNPADALRELRRRALDDWLEHPKDTEKAAWFLNAFMYVYYGNPLALFGLRESLTSEGAQ